MATGNGVFAGNINVSVLQCKSLILPTNYHTEIRGLHQSHQRLQPINFHQHHRNKDSYSQTRASYTVLSRKSAHGRCILLSHQTGGWALFRVFPHSTLKERPPLFTYTSNAIAAIEQQARVSQSPPSTSIPLESLATSPLTTSSSLPPSAG